ncbi:hypothetical protein Anapl_00642 [Anas platyrhynchos]|uniref:Uncharacterized protein n=1 Tax=Anas platyrhynchos TaxID=8839 RepID=R0LC58_ANAPL|nr:hypothetical protein Anapl_00642 [Anas platyrhynchos]
METGACGQSAALFRCRPFCFTGVTSVGCPPTAHSRSLPKTKLAYGFLSNIFLFSSVPRCSRNSSVPALPPALDISAGFRLSRTAAGSSALDSCFLIIHTAHVLLLADVISVVYFSPKGDAGTVGRPAYSVPIILDVYPQARPALCDRLSAQSQKAQK